MTIAERLSALVAESGLPKYKIGEAVNISDSHIGALCAGKKELGKVETAVALADFFGVSLDYLLCRSDERGGGTKKAPALEISENGREMLELYERLPVRDQVLLLGRLQEMVAPLLGSSDRREPPVSEGKAG